MYCEIVCINVKYIGLSVQNYTLKLTIIGAARKLIFFYISIISNCHRSYIQSHHKDVL